MTVLIAGISPFVAVRQFWRLWGPLVQCMPMAKRNAGNLRKLNRHKKSARGCLPWADEISNLRRYRIILSADTASEVRQLLSQKRR